MAYSDEESCFLLSAAKGKIASCTVRTLQQWNVGAGGTTELSNVNYILYYPQIWLVINYANLPSWKLAPLMWTFEQFFSKMNYGIVVCKLKPFEPPEYRLTVAARCGVEGGPSCGWTHQGQWPCHTLLCDPECAVPACSLAQFLSQKNSTYISHRLHLLMSEEKHLILKDDDLFCCRTLSITFLGKLEMSDKWSECFAQSKNIYPLLIVKNPSNHQTLPLE